MRQRSEADAPSPGRGAFAAQQPIAPTSTSATPVPASSPAPTTPVSGSAAAPAVWNDEIRQAFLDLGAPPEEVAAAEAAGLTEDEVITLYENFRAQQAQAGTVTAQAATGEAAAAQTSGPAAQPSGGPAAWDEGWRKKFIAAGATPDIMQQLSFTGAFGADEAQLQQMLDQVKKDFPEVIAALRERKVFKELDKKLDNPQMLQMLAVLEQNPKATDEELLMQADGLAAAGGALPDWRAGSTELPSKVLGFARTGFNAFAPQLPMLAATSLPWMFGPGYGAIRWVAGGDPELLAGEHAMKVERDPRKGGMAAMDAVIALGGLVALGHFAKGFAGVRSTLSMIDKSKAAAPAVSNALEGVHKISPSVINDIAAARNVGNLQGMQRLLAHVPHTPQNRAVMGMSMLGGSNVAKAEAMLQGVPNESLSNLLEQVRNGSVRLQSHSWGINFTPGHMGRNLRGSFGFTGRKNPLWEWKVGKDGLAELWVSPQLRTNRAAGAILSDAGKELLPGGAAAAEAREGVSVLASASKQLGLRYNSPLERAANFVRPSGLADAVKSTKTAQEPSAAALLWKKPLVKVGAIGLLTGAGVQAASRFGPELMGGAPADGEGRATSANPLVRGLEERAQNAAGDAATAEQAADSAGEATTTTATDVSVAPQRFARAFRPR